MNLDAFNLAPAEELRPRLAACCDSRSWVESVVEGRPYQDVSAVFERGRSAYSALAPQDVDHVVATHPRLGAPLPSSTTSSDWSREEASGIDGTDELRSIQQAYEQRFGHIFLIAATGLEGSSVIEAARRRLRNDDESERREVIEQLGFIVLSRLRRVIN